jgi:hypothetical protein
MRSRLRKALKKELERCLREQRPEFKPVKLPDIPYLIVFGSQTLGGWSVFLSFQVSSRDDSFTAECAWSNKGRFPVTLTQMFPVDIPDKEISHDKPRDGEFRFRLSQLVQPGKDFWWHLSPPLTIEDILRQQRHLIETGTLEEEFPVEKALAKVPAAVEEALGWFVLYALPFFSQVAKVDVRVREGTEHPRPDQR